MTWSRPAIMDERRQEGPRDASTQLMLRFKAGDIRAFEELFARHSRSIVQFAYRFVRNREIAEELAQEVFLRVHDAAATYKPEAKFTTWLYRIAANLCLNELRRPHYRAQFEPVDSGTQGESGDKSLRLAVSNLAGPSEKMRRDAISAALKEALAEIPDKQRVAFVLNKYQELSYAEVADAMNLSEKAVKSLIHRAKEALAQRLKPLLPGLI
jgi:RNA polymerase sigma-70 factor, ECF subfamily